MPINPKLKAQLEADTTMTDDYRTKLIATLEDAPPSVQNNWMSQSDYTRQVNEFKQQQTEWKGKADKFYDESKAAVEGFKSEAEKAKEAAAQAQARLAELEASGGGGGLPKVPDAIVNEIAGLKNLITSLESKFTGAVSKDDLNKAYQSAVGFIGEQVFEMNEISATHQERFGKRFTKSDQEKLIEYANKRSTELGHRISLDEAYNQMNSEDIKKLERTTIEKEVEEKLRTAHQIPGGGDGAAGGAPTERGPAQIRLEQEQNRRNGVTDASKIGYADWREAALAGANELVSEGKG